MPISNPVRDSTAAQSAATPPALVWEGDPAEHSRQIALAVINVLQGRMNNTVSVTLTASAASTTITDARIGRNTCLLLLPTTANAAAALATTYQTHPNATSQQAVINHANNAQADRTFIAVMIG